MRTQKPVTQGCRIHDVGKAQGQVFEGSKVEIIINGSGGIGHKEAPIIPHESVSGCGFAIAVCRHPCNYDFLNFEGTENIYLEIPQTRRYIPDNRHHTLAYFILANQGMKCHICIHDTETSIRTAGKRPG